ncbi:MAG TPA: protein-L-isoaspartate O-methyltransferase, partial [Solirubrobacterales bacterium]|nr:protein-L-isoaspartate O-methyltransferase [Solirubrobacterales bacterium]
HEPLSGAAARALEELGVGNVELLIGDGSLGVPERAPFDAIAVHATAPAAPPALLDQLADGGRLVVPIAAPEADMLTVLRRRGEEIGAESLGPCRFVPLIGEEGY